MESNVNQDIDYKLAVFSLQCEKPGKSQTHHGNINVKKSTKAFDNFQRIPPRNF